MLIYGIRRYDNNVVVYVGQTIQKLRDRKLRHYSDVRTGRDSILCRAFRKHGLDCFEFFEIENDISSAKELNKKEKFYIKKYGTFPPGSNCYNMTEGGRSSCEFSEEYRLKLSVSQKKRYEDPKERQRTSETSKKMYLENPDINRKKAKAMKKRYEDNPELREKQSILSKTDIRYIKGRKNAHKSIMKKVICVETGEVFESITKAARKNNVAAPSIFKSLNRGTKCKGFHFVFFEKKGEEDGNNKRNNGKNKRNNDGTGA
jgi:group I intron endonuclease